MMWSDDEFDQKQFFHSAIDLNNYIFRYYFKRFNDFLDTEYKQLWYF